MIELPNLANWISSNNGFANDFIVSVWPIFGWFLGISVTVFIVQMIIETIQEGLAEIQFRKSGDIDYYNFQNMYGEKAGADMYSEWGSFTDMLPSQRKFLMNYKTLFPEKFKSQSRYNNGSFNQSGVMPQPWLGPSETRPETMDEILKNTRYKWD
jgi:hypothetical protein